MAQASIAQMNGRADRAAGIVAAGGVVASGAGRWVVTDRASGSGRGRVAQIDSCDCPDHARRGVVCKHMLAVRAVLGVASCPTCGAACQRESFRIGGRGLVAFEVCTADRTHQAQPVE